MMQLRYILRYKLLKKYNIYNILRKLSYSLKVIKIEKIRCQTGYEFSDHLGFGGKHIKYFPPHQFFKLYLKDPNQAKKDFKDWIYLNFVEKSGWKIPKSKGGYYLGSLYSEIKISFDEKNLMMNTKNLKSQKEMINYAINKRIDHYFTTFKSIIEKGFNPDLYPITTKKINGLYYLYNGHHRIAMLHVLGYKDIVLLKKNFIASLTNLRFKKKSPRFDEIFLTKKFT